MKTNLIGVLRDVQLSTLALAIALGWSLYQTALGVGTFIEGVTTRASPESGCTGYVPGLGTGLTWVWGDHVFSFGQFVMGLIELVTVLLIAALVRRHSRSVD